MNPVTLRRHPLKFYFVIFFMAIFCCSLGGLILWVGVRSGERGESGYLTMVAFALVFILLGIFTVFKYFSNTPVVRADQYQVTFNDTEAYQWQDLSSVELSGKQPFKYLLTFQMEGMILRFRSGNEKYLYDDLYANTGEMKSFIQQVVVDKQAAFTYHKENANTGELPAETFVSFKGNQFTSLRGLTIWGMYAVIAIMLISRPHYFDNINIPKFVLVFGAFCVAWFFFLSLLLNYFLVSEHYLVVKNHNLFWKNRIYKLSDIREVTIETQGKMPNSFRIITKDFDSKVFPAGTLRDKHWRILKEKLERKGIRVRNDSPFLNA